MSQPDERLGTERRSMRQNLRNLLAWPFTTIGCYSLAAAAWISEGKLGLQRLAMIGLKVDDLLGMSEGEFRALLRREGYE